MLIYIIWTTFIEYKELYEYFAAIFFSIIALPIDILFLPFEILTLIIYKMNNKN